MKFFREDIDLHIDHPAEQVLRQLAAFTHQNNGDGAAKVAIPRFHGVFKDDEFCIMQNGLTRNIFRPWLDAKVVSDGDDTCRIRGSLHLDGIVLSLLLIFEALCLVMCVYNLIRVIAGVITAPSAIFLWLIPAGVALLLGGINFLHGARKTKNVVCEVLSYIK